ncbi:hypothetical protein [Rhodococcus sp. IEGM 1379]|uniref:hypothetical protein n=1 Tax=Rhodococcus sp. IEGM 1379 TaxID=3047086 RepID=UPI0024B75247|nr:hypothetical protein [Rhodococcus sp. IEGM 1379]MDI9914335.1 hypothetical protein [Rhodococcus sp. IEGM 1379]
MTQPPPPFQPDSNVDHAWHDGYNLGLGHGAASVPRPTHPVVWVVTGAVGALAIAGAMFGAVTLIGKANAPTVFTMTGTMSLDSSDSSSTGSGCVGDGGYDDIHSGTEVKVTNGDGKTVATGRLESGDRSSGECVLPFTIKGVPAGSEFYEVEVSHRGGLTYSEAEAREPLFFSLG